MPLTRPTRPPAPAPAAGQYLYTTSPFVNATSAALGVGTLRLTPWMVESALRIDRLGADITSAGEAGSKLRLGIYADNGSSYPGALLLDAGQIAGDSATVQELTVSLTLAAGLYWIGGAVQSVTTTQPTVRTINSWTAPVTLGLGTSLPSTGGVALGYSQTGVTGALPATFTTSVRVVSLCPRLIARAA